MSRRFAVSLRHDETLGSVRGGLGVQADGLIETRGADLSIEAAFQTSTRVPSCPVSLTLHRAAGLGAAKTPGDARSLLAPR